MSIVATCQRIATTALVLFGHHGSVSAHAQERGVSRQSLYRQADATLAAVEANTRPATLATLEQRCQQQQTSIEELQTRLRVLEQQRPLTVTIDADRQAEFASLGQASGVSLPVLQQLLSVLLRADTPSVAQLGRYSQAAAQRASNLLTVLDEVSRPLVQQVAADEIFTGQRPILMVVAPDSWCWLNGRLTEHRDGQEWAKEFATLPHIKQVIRDGGSGMAKGLQVVNEERGQNNVASIASQDDHFHVLREGQRALRRQQAVTTRAMAQAEKAEKRLARCRRQGQNEAGLTVLVNRRWRQAEQSMDCWTAQERTWQRVKGSLDLFTPAGELNTRERAEAEIAKALPQLTGPVWAKVRRQLCKPTLFTFLDRLHQQLAAVPMAAEVRATMVRSEGLKRRPHLLEGDNQQAAARRGLLLVAAVLHSLLLDESGQMAVAAIRGLLQQAWRASSVVEGLNSVLRMQQARHRRLTQGLLDLKRLYWNCRPLRTGRRKGTTPYQRMGLILPPCSWWELLKRTPEQLRQELSAQGVAT